MTRYVYMVETSTEKSILGIKVFSSQKAAEKLKKEFPKLKHKITKMELLNLNHF